MTRQRRRSACCAGALAWFVPAACALQAVEPAPLVGASPTAIAVWPVPLGDDAAVASTGAAAALDGLDVLVGRRGYRVVAPAVAAQLLADAHVDTASTDMAAAGRATEADALLQLVVRVLELDDDDGLRSARWDLEWRLVSTHGGGIQWRFAHHGTWQRNEPDRPTSLRRADAPPDIVPIGGVGARNFRDRADLLHSLNRFAIDHLPRRDS